MDTIIFIAVIVLALIARTIIRFVLSRGRIFLALWLVGGRRDSQNHKSSILPLAAATMLLAPKRQPPRRHRW